MRHRRWRLHGRLRRERRERLDHRQPRDGPPYPYDGTDGNGSVSLSTATEGPSTTHLTVSDKWGNIVSYTFTIEQTGGSAITVPGHGVILNNELTDFEPVPGLANSPAGGKRPRSSISPTEVTDNGTRVVALGSPGGLTIITTVLQVLVNDLDFGMTLPEAIAAPRASQRNTATTSAEPQFLNSPEAAPLVSEHGQSFTATPEIGAAPQASLSSQEEPYRRRPSRSAAVGGARSWRIPSPDAAGDYG